MVHWKWVVVIFGRRQISFCLFIDVAVPIPELFSHAKCFGWCCCCCLPLLQHHCEIFCSSGCCCSCVGVVVLVSSLMKCWRCCCCCCRRASHFLGLLLPHVGSWQLKEQEVTSSEKQHCWDDDTSIRHRRSTTRTAQRRTDASVEHEAKNVPKRPWWSTSSL